MTMDRDVILAFESALEQHNLTNGKFNSKIHVYSLKPLPNPFKVHLVDNYEDIDFIDVRGLKTTTLSKTINDMLSNSDVDPYILAESLSNYYYEHNESFDGIVVAKQNIMKFKEYKQWAIEYYDE